MVRGLRLLLRLLLGAVFVYAAYTKLRQSWLLFALATYIAMNLVVVPLRFPAAWPPKSMAIGTQLFAHIVLVGLPTAFIARRYLRPRGF